MDIHMTDAPISTSQELMVMKKPRELLPAQGAHDMLHPLQRYPCPFPECQRSQRGFTERRTLLRHLRTVHQPGLYPCSTCGKRFKRQDILDRHELEQHGDDVEGTVRCITCNKDIRRRAIEGHWKSKAHLVLERQADERSCRDFLTRINPTVAQLPTVEALVDPALLSTFLVMEINQRFKLNEVGNISPEAMPADLLELRGLSIRVLAQSLPQTVSEWSANTSHAFLMDMGLYAFLSGVTVYELPDDNPYSRIYNLLLWHHGGIVNLVQFILDPLPQEFQRLQQAIPSSEEDIRDEDVDLEWLDKLIEAIGDEVDELSEATQHMLERFLYVSIANALYAFLDATRSWKTSVEE